MEDIVLDTDIIIEYLRAKNKSNTLLIDLMEKHNLFSTPITEFELFLGAKTVRHKHDIEMIFHEVQVLPFDFGCGEIAANIWADLTEKNQHCEIRDIFVASVAIFHDLRICTFNKKHFRGIKDIRIWEAVEK